LRGYSIDHLDGLAVLQHYGWPSPLIDFSATLEVAIFFALLGAKPDSTSIIYMLECEQLPPEAIVVDHDFLTHNLEGGGLKHRLLRQDGFAVTKREWGAVGSAV